MPEGATGWLEEDEGEKKNSDGSSGGDMDRSSSSENSKLLAWPIDTIAAWGASGLEGPQRRLADGGIGGILLSPDRLKGD